MTTAAHYRLTSDEFLNINSKLSDAQLRVYLYYKTLDPFGDRKVEVCTKAIAEILAIKQRTVQRALNKLCELGLLIWEKAKSVVRRSQDRPSDRRIAQAIVGSPKRSEDRERQLELNLHNDSATSQSSSILFNLDQDLEGQEILNFENSEIESNHSSENLEMSLEEIRDLINRELSGESEEVATERNNLDAPLMNEDTTEDLDFDDEDLDDCHEEAIEAIDEENSELDLDPKVEPDFVPEKPSTAIEVDSFRRRVEDFVLKTLNKSFPTEQRRAAYFRKFDAKSWKKWEAQYREATKPQVAYKPYVPEKVEVAPPDSPVALSAIAQIKAKLGIKS